LPEQIWGESMGTPLSAVNFDGIVNMNDFVKPADDWMTPY
jgi:hypothetical protein